MGTIELSTADRRHLWGRLAIRSMGLATIVLLSIYALPPLIKMFFPFVAGVIAAWLLHPVIDKIRSKVKIPRKILSMVFTVLVAIVLGGIVVLVFYALINQVISFISNWLKSGGNISDLLSPGNLLSDILSRLPDEMSVWIQNMVAQAAEWLTVSFSTVLSSLTRGLGDFLTRIPTFFVGIVVSLSATYFILADFPALRSSVYDRYQGGMRNFFGLVQNASTTAFGAYLKSQLLLSFGVFGIILIGFLIMKQSYAFLLALLLGVVDFIPVIGSGVILMPWAVITLLQGEHITALSLAIIWILASAFRKLFEPKVVGSQTGLSPLLSLVSIFIGMRIAGITGMILGPIILQITLIVAKSGLFGGFVRDLKLFADDVQVFIKKQPATNDGEALGTKKDENIID